MNTFILYLLITAGGGADWNRYHNVQPLETMAECKALGRQITGRNFHIRNYMCQGPAEVQAEYFPAEETAINQE